MQINYGHNTATGVGQGRGDPISKLLLTDPQLDICRSTKRSSNSKVTPRTHVGCHWALVEEEFAQAEVSDFDQTSEKKPSLFNLAGYMSLLAANHLTYLYQYKT